MNMEGQEEVQLSQGPQEGDSRGGSQQYSMPGVVQFIQHEWSMFERERARWEVERAELQARVAFLQGERKGQENLKHDLMRRIKMLEYALHQERQRYHKLKYGKDPPYAHPEKPTDSEEGPPGPSVNHAGANVELRPGRQLLLQYLHEVGCTDNMLEIRRARQFLYPTGVDPQATPGSPFSSHVSRTSTSSPPPGVEHTRPCSPLTSYSPFRQPEPNGPEFPMHDQNEATPEINGSTAGSGQVESDIVEDSFKFLDNGDDEDDDEEEDNDPILGDVTVEAELEETSTEDVMAEFEFLNDMGGEESASDATNGIEVPATGVRSHGVPTPALPSTGSPSRHAEDASLDLPKKWHRPGRKALKTMMHNMPAEDEPSPTGAGPGSLGSLLAGQETTPAPAAPHSSTGENLEMLGLGELAGLSVPGESEPAVEGTNLVARRKMWNLKHSLRSHFDCVRSMAFHPTKPCIVTASEDRTLKLWNLDKATQPKKSALPEVEPVYTFRGHRGAALCVQCTNDGQYCVSGGGDGQIYRWSLHSLSGDLYDPFDTSSEDRISLAGHTDAVWDLAVHNSHTLLASASSDGTCRIWNWMSGNLMRTLTPPTSNVGTPTCVDFVANEPGQIVVGYTSSQPVIYDYETGKSVCLFQSDSSSTSSNTRINCIACHPTLDMTIAGTEDRRIQFFDNRSGQVTHSMVAHLESVTSLAIDRAGLYLLTGSHDCSLRLWNLEGRTCVQEMTSHRKKCDESVLGVAFHPSLGYLGSCGADSVAKVYV
ncbi:striatin-like [Sycon ciliatum]|uniref:striatin-like n=1 Tax=Sycon ciliatum TaxID=27933 RepID=UPI0031F5FCC0